MSQSPEYSSVPGLEKRTVRAERRGEPAQIGFLLHPPFLYGIDNKRLYQELQGSSFLATAESVLGKPVDTLLGAYQYTPAGRYVLSEFLQLIGTNNAMEQMQQSKMPLPTVVAGPGIPAAVVSGALLFEDAVRLMQVYAEGVTTFLERTAESEFDTLYVGVDRRHPSEKQRQRQQAAIRRYEKSIPSQHPEVWLSGVADDYITFGGTVKLLENARASIEGDRTSANVVVRELGIGLPIHTELLYIDVAAPLAYAVTQIRLNDPQSRMLSIVDGKQLQSEKHVAYEIALCMVRPFQEKRVAEQMQERGLVEAAGNGIVQFFAETNTPQKILMGLATVTTLVGVGFAAHRKIIGRHRRK